MDFFKQWLEGYGLDPVTESVIVYSVVTLLVIVACVLANWITKKIVLRVLTLFITRNKVEWDDMFIERRVFQKLSHIVPAIIIYYASDLYADFPVAEMLIEKAAVIYILLVVLSSLNAFLNAVNDIYNTYEISKTRPIKGILQVIKIVFFFIGGIVIIATLINQNPMILLGGLGALSAVLLLVFQNAILGLVAGIQLTSNDMVRVGDWIEMPKYNADGDVLEITLTTVKVQNWDKTITMIPAAAFINDAFKNWRGMQETGGRRIKRSVFVDVSSIQFCTDEMIERYRKIHFLKDYIDEKEKELAEYNRKHNIDPSSKVNGRRLTNIGTYRIYIQRYLDNHPHIHKGLTCMVRQLAPGEHGLPLEIYAFTSDTRWVYYESIQSDIFDHILAVAPEFGLRVYQNPSGHDMRNMLREAAGSPLLLNQPDPPAGQN